MTSNERIQAVLQRQRADCTPISFWHHFPQDAWSGLAAVDAHDQHVERFGVDFCKVMYDLGYPRDGLPAGVVQAPQDLARIRLADGQEAVFAAHYDVLQQLRMRLGDLPICTTVFNAWATLQDLLRPLRLEHGPPKLDVSKDPRPKRMAELLAADRSAVGRALQTIAEGTAAFASNCIAAGADGMFLSVREDWVNTPANGMETYEQMVRPTDHAILAGASAGWFNLLHVCGRPQNLPAFARYPHVHVINWADRAGGPSIAEVRDVIDPVICGGMDNLCTWATGTPKSCAEEARDALRQAGDRPMILGPGCTYDPAAVKEKNLLAVVAVAHGT
jgi:uroporphyrinogen decarboxylase